MPAVKNGAALFLLDQEKLDWEEYNYIIVGECMKWKKAHGTDVDSVSCKGRVEGCLMGGSSSPSHSLGHTPL